MPPPHFARHVGDYYRRNRAHLAPWEPERPEAFFTDEFWIVQLEQNRAEYAAGTSVRTFVLPRRGADRAVLGSVNFTNIVRGAFQSCTVGYSLDHEATGHGYMTEALDAGVEHVFRALDLHRVAANYMPENERSAKLLARLGFVEEGFAPKYLRIAGEWRDHVLTAKVRAP